MRNSYKYPVPQFLLLNYYILNRWLIDNKDLEISKYSEWLFPVSPLWVYFLIINLLAMFLLVRKKIRFNHSPNYYFAIFIIFQFTNIYNIDSSYFWETIPDARSYVKLGTTLLECGELAFNCGENPYLVWPIGQPLISGLLFTYFYESSKYIYVTIFAVSFFLMMKISFVKFKNFYHVGAIYFLILQNNFDSTAFVISEIPYLFFTSIGIYTLSTKKYSESLIVFIISFLIRPIGIVNFLLFFFIAAKNKVKISKYFLILFLTFFSYMTYNYFMNNSFTISTTVQTNIERDGYAQNLSTFEYAENLFDADNINFIINNMSNLYGEGSRNCAYKQCFFYNPLFLPDGTQPNILNKNSVLGRFLQPILIKIFQISSPLSFWVYTPFLLIVPFYKKDYFSRGLILLYFLNLFFSVLTIEFGNRWWLILNLFSIYLLSNVAYSIKFITLIKS